MPGGPGILGATVNRRMESDLGFWRGRQLVRDRLEEPWWEQRLESGSQGRPWWSSAWDLTFQHGGCGFDPWAGN